MESMDEREAALTIVALEECERKAFGEAVLIDADHVYAQNECFHKHWECQHNDEEEEARLNEIAIAALLAEDERQVVATRTNRQEETVCQQDLAIRVLEARKQLSILTKEPLLHDVLEMLVTTGGGVNVERIELITLVDSYKLTLYVNYYAVLSKQQEEGIQEHFKRLRYCNVAINQIFSPSEQQHCIYLDVQPSLIIKPLTLEEVKEKLMYKTSQHLLYEMIEKMLGVAPRLQLFDVKLSGNDSVYKLRLETKYPTSFSYEEERAVVAYFDNYYAWTLSFYQSFNHAKRQHHIHLRAHRRQDSLSDSKSSNIV